MVDVSFWTAAPLSIGEHRSESQGLIIIITGVKRLVSVSSPAQILLSDPATSSTRLLAPFSPPRLVSQPNALVA